MGCGASKTSKESILDAATVPAASVKPRIPETHRPPLVAEPSNKLAPEVLEGFARLIRRFSTVEITAKNKTTARGSQPNKAAKGPAGQSATMPIARPKEEKKDPPKVETHPEPKPNPQPDPLPSEQPPTVSSAAPMMLSSLPGAATDMKNSSFSEPRQAFGDSHTEDQRYSPEPPRPDSLSDEEVAQPYEDEGLRKKREEMERLAQEEAQRKAARDREEGEKLAMAQKGKMASMENQANDILSKYQ